MNNAIGMHGLPHLPKGCKRDRTTLAGYPRNQGDEQLEESPVASMRIAALISISAMASIILLALSVLLR